MDARALRGLFGFVNLAKLKKGLWITLGVILGVIVLYALMTALRAIAHPQPVVFETGETGNGDYMVTVLMGALLIALDAMLVVILSWSYLRDKTDALVVATMVAMTHVCFPLLTFGITVGVQARVEAAGLPTIFAWGAQSTIYAVAFLLISWQLWNAHTSVRSTDVERFDPKDTLSIRALIVKVWGPVFAVSIDALIVGPSKVAFAARYSPFMLYLSFVLVGVLVFAFVCGSGFAAIGLKWRAKRAKAHRTQLVVHYINCSCSLALIAALIYFFVFAGVHFMRTFVEAEWLLTPATIWGIAIALFVTFLLFGKIRDIRTASKQRAGLVELSA